MQIGVTGSDGICKHIHPISLSAVYKYACICCVWLAVCVKCQLRSYSLSKVWNWWSKVTLIQIIQPQYKSRQKSEIETENK